MRKLILGMTTVIVVIIVIIILAGLSSVGYLALLQDKMIYYDDFETGKRTDLWDISYDWMVFVRDGVTNTYSSCNQGCCNNQGVEYRAGTMTSTKLWATEDLKIEYSYKYTTDGNCPDPDPPFIKFGNANMPINYGQRIYSYGNSQIISNTGTLEIKRYDDLDLTRYVVLINGDEVVDSRNLEAVPLIFGGDTLVVYEVKYKPYYSCVMDRSTEVVVRDKFSAGSQVSIKDLSYLPKKFCPEDLGVLIVSTEGVTQELGSLSKRVAEGETLTVPFGESYYFRYIANYETDMKEHCTALDSEYSTELQSCISSGVKPADKIIEVDVPTVIVIPGTTNEVTFKTSRDLKIAGKPFLMTDMQPLIHKQECQVERGSYLPTHRPGCYGTQVAWGDYNFYIENGETKVIDEHIKVSYTLSGRGVFNGVKFGTDYNYEFIEDFPENYFTLTFTDIFDVSIDSYQERVLLDAPNSVQLIITNNLFELTDASFKVKVTKNLIDEYLPTETVKTSFLAGENTYSVDLPTDTLGSYSIEILPSFLMDEVTEYVADEKVNFGYYVASQPNEINCKDIGCSVGDCQADGTCLVTKEKIVYQEVPIDKLDYDWLIIAGIAGFIAATILFITFGSFIVKLIKR